MSETEETLLQEYINECYSEAELQAKAMTAEDKRTLYKSLGFAMYRLNKAFTAFTKAVEDSIPYK